jgi:hypothetical protein
MALVAGSHPDRLLGSLIRLRGTINGDKDFFSEIQHSYRLCPASLSVALHDFELQLRKL